MTTNLQRPTYRHTFQDRCRGTILSIVPFVIILLLSIGLFVVDLAHLHATKSNLQNAADSASLTGAIRLRIAHGETTEAIPGDKKMKVGKKDKKQLGTPQQNQVAFVPDLQNLCIKFAKLNHPEVAGILSRSDIQIGTWNFTTRRFTIGSTDDANAVRVTVRRTAGKSEPVSLLLAQFFGFKGADMEVTSISAFNTFIDGTGEEFYSMPYLVD